MQLLIKYMIRTLGKVALNGKADNFFNNPLIHKSLMSND